MYVHICMCTVLVIAVAKARTLNASSDLQLHSVVGNKYSIQQVTMKYSVILYEWANSFHEMNKILLSIR